MTPTAFFYRHAGYRYPAGAASAVQRAHRLNGAKRLARAESFARDEGYSFDWAIDDRAGSREWTDELPAWETWRCIMRDVEGRNVGSLWGVDFGPGGEPWGDTYRRVVEAELAAELEG